MCRSCGYDSGGGDDNDDDCNVISKSFEMIN
jgi:hypothetical protein